MMSSELGYNTYIMNLKLNKVVSMRGSPPKTAPTTHQVNRHNYSTGDCSYRVTKLDDRCGKEVVIRYDNGEPRFSIDYKVFTGSEQACNDFVRSQFSLR